MGKFIVCAVFILLMIGLFLLTRKGKSVSKVSNKNPKDNVPFEPPAGRGHYYEGNIGYRASCRSNQRKRRKMARRKA